MYYQNGKHLETMVLSEQQWNQRLKNIFDRNIRDNHISGCIISIGYEMSGCVVERAMDTGDITIATDEYKRLYKTAGVKQQTVS